MFMRLLAPLHDRDGTGSRWNVGQRTAGVRRARRQRREGGRSSSSGPAGSATAREAQGGGATGPGSPAGWSPWPAFSRYVRRPTEEMIPYTAKVLPDKELADIYAWLRAIPAPPPVASIPQLAPRK